MASRRCSIVAATARLHRSSDSPGWQIALNRDVVEAMVAKAVVAPSTNSPGPANDATPKFEFGRRPGSVALLPVANRALIVHALHALREAGVRDVAILAEPWLLRQLHAAVSEERLDGVSLSWLEHDPRDAEQLATFARGGEPVAVHLADSLSHSPLRPLLTPPESARDATLVTHHGAPKEVVIDLERRRAAGRGPTLAPSASPAGVWVLGSDVLAEACELAVEAPLEDGIATAIGRTLERGGHVSTVEAMDWWRYRNQPEVLLDANRFALQGLQGEHPRATLIDACVQGAVVIDPTAVLESSVVRGPAVIGSGARLRDAYIGPYSSIGPDVLVEGAEIEHSIVLPGASICHVGGRLEASVVGPRAKIFRDFRLPKALRLNIGEGAEVSLA
jgi:glucose-1-phosphate thymidylyltransferase